MKPGRTSLPTAAGLTTQLLLRARGEGMPRRWAARVLGSPWTYIIGLPLLASLPQLLGLLDANPLIRTAYLTLHAHGAPVPGWPVLDPDDGSTAQALGSLAAYDWIHGIVPWWNPFSGTGLPLAGEYQPGAFFPLVLLYLLPRGTVLLHVALQIIASWGTFRLLGRLVVRRPAAVAGGVLYAFNGTLAWYGNGPPSVLPFLPWALFAIERIRDGRRSGWALLAAALALSLLAGFPETAYLDGLLILCWTALRFAQGPATGRLRFAALLALAVVVALALSAPQLLAFAEFLSHAFVAGHNGTEFASLATALPALAPTLAPYVFGPIYAALVRWPAVLQFQANLGGYASLALIALATFGLLSRRSPLCWLLAFWCVFSLTRTFGFYPAIAAWNLIPGMTRVAVWRYVAPSWELAVVLLAAFGIDEIYRRGKAFSRPAWLLAVLCATALWLTVVVLAVRTVPGNSGVHAYEAGSLLEAALAAAGVLLLISRGKGRWVAGVISGEAVVLAVMAGLSNPRHASWDRNAVAFLETNIKLDRFYSLGPFQPNYSAYFRVPSVNYNYLPVPQQWVSWVQGNLDSGTNEIVLNGMNRRDPGAPKAAEQLRKNLRNFELVGTKYIVAPSRARPDLGGSASLVYSDSLLAIYQLPHPAPYFDVAAGDCDRPVATERTSVGIYCRTPATLVRREMFFPGWRATINGAEAGVVAYKGIFQSVLLRPGPNAVRFTYAPPGVRFAWLACAIGGVLLAFGVWADCTRRR